MNMISECCHPALPCIILDLHTACYRSVQSRLKRGRASLVSAMGKKGKWPGLMRVMSSYPCLSTTDAVSRSCLSSSFIRSQARLMLANCHHCHHWLASSVFIMLRVYRHRLGPECKQTKTTCCLLAAFQAPQVRLTVKLLKGFSCHHWFIYGMFSAIPTEIVK